MSQAEQLRELQNDMRQMYSAAKDDDNKGLMERLAKSIAGMAKQIKEQEIHERETLPRTTVIRAMQVAGTELAKRAKEELGEAVVPVLVDVAFECELIAEAELDK